MSARLRGTDSVRSRGTDSARVVEVIETTSLRGSGTQGDPYRSVVQYWSRDGELLAERDTFEPQPGEAALVDDVTRRG